MIRVQIAYEVPAEALARVAAVLEDVARWDINWCGAEFKIERGDFTCLPDLDDGDAVALFDRLQAVIRNEQE